MMGKESLTSLVAKLVFTVQEDSVGADYPFPLNNSHALGCSLIGIAPESAAGKQLDKTSVSTAVKNLWKRAGYPMTTKVWYNGSSGWSLQSVWLLKKGTKETRKSSGFAEYFYLPRSAIPDVMTSVQSDIICDF